MFDKYLNLFGWALFDEKGEGGGGGAGDIPEDKGDDKGLSATIEELKAANAKLLERLDALEKSKGKNTDTREGDLVDRTRKEREDRDNRDKSDRTIESALSFQMALPKFLEEHRDILPSEVSEIVKAAEKENYESKVHKSNAVRAAVMKSFFDVQSNQELLTERQKQRVQDYFKLTLKAREEKSSEIYEDVFEPALEMLKRVKKADELNRARNGLATSSKSHDAYKEKLIAHSRKYYFGDKGK